MVNEFHAMGVKVVLWATSVIGIDCPNYLEAYEKGYMLTGAICNYSHCDASNDSQLDSLLAWLGWLH